MRVTDSTLCFCGHTARLHQPLDRGTHTAHGGCNGTIPGAGGEQPCTCPSFRPIPGQPKKRPNRARHYACGLSRRTA